MRYQVGKPGRDNNLSDLIEDVVLEERLACSTSLNWREEQCPLVAVRTQKDEAEAGAIAMVDGIRVFIPSTRIIKITENGMVHFKTLRLRPRLSIGFLFYNGAAKYPNSNEVLRLYREAGAPDELLPIWESLITKTEQWNIPIRMKILSRSYEYPRRDALVLYLPRPTWNHLPDIYRVLKSAGPLDRNRQGFAKKIDSRVMCAWEPVDSNIPYGKESFGQHRARVIAEGILNDLAKGSTNNSSLYDKLVQANIDPTAIYRNLNSPDIADRISTQGVLQ